MHVQQREGLKKWYLQEQSHLGQLWEATLINGGSTKNVLSTSMVEKLTFKMERKLHPYWIAWLWIHERHIDKHRYLVKFLICSVYEGSLIDGGSDMVEKLTLKMEWKLHQYQIAWSKVHEPHVVKHYWFVKFSIHRVYVDSITCDVVPMSAGTSSSVNHDFMTIDKAWCKSQRIHFPALGVAAYILDDADQAWDLHTSI